MLRMFETTTITYMYLFILCVYGIGLYGYVAYRTKRARHLDIYIVAFFFSIAVICSTNLVVRAYIFYTIDRVKHLETYIRVLDSFLWHMRYIPLVVVLTVFIGHRTYYAYRHFKGLDSKPHRRHSDL